jgi:hypothetical protein
VFTSESIKELVSQVRYSRGDVERRMRGIIVFILRFVGAGFRRVGCGDVPGKRG